MSSLAAAVDQLSCHSVSSFRGDGTGWRRIRVRRAATNGCRRGGKAAKMNLEAACCAARINISRPAGCQRAGRPEGGKPARADAYGLADLAVGGGGLTGGLGVAGAAGAVLAGGLVERRPI